MRPLVRRSAVVGSLALAPLVVSAMASATDTALGGSAAPTVSCGGPLTVLQTATATGSTPYAAPTAGVITSIRIPGPATATTRAFKLARPAGGNDYTIVGGTDPAALAANQVLTQSVRIPTKVGDRLGVYVAESSNCATLGATGDTVAFVSDNAAIGSTATYSPTSPYRLSVSAVVEPDADGDGYGDTTQDKCSVESSTQATCVLGRVRGTGKVGKRLAAPTVPDLPVGATKKYQWQRLVTIKRHGHTKHVWRAIAAAHGASYKVRGADRGTKVRVQITVTPLGATPVTITSRAKRAHS